MAHADYECCACCDAKGEYAVAATSKGIICAECAATLSMATGRRITTWEALNQYISDALATGSKHTAAYVLRGAGFRYCRYSGSDTDNLAAQLPQEVLFDAGR